MALKLKKSCTVCQTLKEDKALLRRIYLTKQYVPGGEPLQAIADDPKYKDKFNYRTLWNHCKVHQGLSEDDMADRAVVRRAKQIELARLDEAITHNQARQELVEIGMEQIRSKEVKMNPSTVASLLKQQSDIEEKQKDRQIEIMKMIQSFQSGEIKYVSSDVIDAEQG